jgi:hypothetical protein
LTDLFNQIKNFHLREKLPLSARYTKKSEPKTGQEITKGISLVSALRWIFLGSWLVD